jgi:hypothetical protein
MGFKSYFKKLRKRNSCCQGKSDYIDSSLKNEKKVISEDFLKKNTQIEEENILNEKHNENNVINNDKINEIKSNEVDEANILSDENINQLRKRNPRLNRFDTNVIRLSLRKSLYDNNLEQDLENFLKEQQKETQKFENSESRYTLSDLKELYDLINNITIKESTSEEESNDPLTNDSKSESVNILKNEDEIYINLVSDIKENPLKIETKNLNNSKNLFTKSSPSENNSNLMHDSPEQSYIEVINSTSKYEKRQFSNNIMKSPGLNYSEILNQSANQSTNNETIDKSQNVLGTLQQQNSSEMENQLPVEKITEPSHNYLRTSPQQSYSDITYQLPEDESINKNNDMLCSSPQQSCTDIVCESPKDEFDNSNDNDRVLCSSPQQSFTGIVCESPKDEFDNCNDNNRVLCSSPQQSFTGIVCESPKDESSKDETDNFNNHMLCSSPQQSYTDVVCESPKDEIENNFILCESPKQNYTDVVCESPKDEIENNFILCESPKQSYTDVVCQSPEDELNNQIHTQQNLTDKICESPTKSSENSPKLQRKSTGFENSFNAFGSFNSLRSNNNKPIRRNNGSAPTSHDKNLLFSQLKMTELSRKDDSNSLLMQNVLGSAKSMEEKYKSSLYSMLSSDSFQSINSYISIDNLSSRKITRRGLKVINSKDTLDRQKPINLKPRNRKALLIGINYTGKPFQLNGCINDANFIMKFLIRNYDFKRDDCKIMTDDSKDETLIPTRKNIINAMKWLVKDAKPNDSLFFHYSGHGLSIKDRDGDEIDGMDESILPLDYEENGVILDDLINDIMIKPLPKGCLLTALADCCHSGTVLDLPYTYKCNGEIENVRDIDENNEEIDKEYLTNEIYKKNKMVQEIVSRNSSQPKLALSLEERISIDNYAKKVKSSEADVIQFSSCRDNEISADERANGNTYGALCNAFISTLTSVILEEKTISYIDILVEIRKIIKKKYGQTPQISTCRPMDVNKPFEL